MQTPLRKLAVAAAALAVLGLGVLGGFVLPSSGAQGKPESSYTYPTTTKPTTTKPETTDQTTTTEETTTEETTTSATSTTTDTSSTTTDPETTTSTTADRTTTAAPQASYRSSRRIRAARNRTLGADIVVDASGMTLYHLISERNHKILCTGGCTTVWPPLLLPPGAKPLPGRGVTSARLGTIRRLGGRLQWTYGGFPLYRFSGDRKPGDARGEGNGGVWYAVGPSGRIVKKSTAGGGYG
jgi:predicted lipoprotein with Yx(FWY)xxD motif